MRADSFRFTPPRLESDATLRWVLQSAFAPSTAGLEEPREGDEALRLAAWLGLAARIGHRVRHSAAGERSRIAEAFVHDHRRAAAQSLRLLEAARVTAGVAAAAGIPLILLKGVALVAAGHVATGRRELFDLDVLVPARRARELSSLVERRGFARSPIRGVSHHLPVLCHPELGALEIHLHLSGVGLRGRSPATAEQILALGLCAETALHPGALLPTPPLMAAHVVAHGIAQHGFSPAAYPLLRTLADLVDLGTATGDLELLLDSARPLLRSSVSERELRSVVELCQRLVAGEIPGGGDPNALLRHAICGRLDPRYRRRLKWSALGRALRRGDWRRLLGRVRLVLQPPRPAG